MYSRTNDDPEVNREEISYAVSQELAIAESVLNAKLEPNSPFKQASKP